MINQDGLSIDLGDFEKKMGELQNKIAPEAVERAMALAGMQALNDAVMDSPTVPLDEGTLRGSGSVFVNNKLIGTSDQNVHTGNPTPAKQHSEFIPPGAVIAVVGFNTPYAARLHEHPKYNFAEPGSGGKFLSHKLTNNRNDYMRIVARAIREDISRKT